jgi:hypothetical protein
MIDDYDISYGYDGLKEGVDYTVSREGFRVMTEDYLTRRGYCCRYCPYWPKAQKGNTVLMKK